MINCVIKNLIQSCSYLLRKNIWNILMYFIFVAVSVFSSINAKAQALLWQPPIIEMLQDTEAMEDIENALPTIQEAEGYKKQFYKDGKGKSIGYGTYDAKKVYEGKNVSVPKDMAISHMRMHLYTDYVELRPKFTIEEPITMSQSDKIVCLTHEINTLTSIEKQKFKNNKKYTSEIAVNPDVLIKKCITQNKSKINLWKKKNHDFKANLLDFVYNIGLTKFLEKDLENWQALAKCTDNQNYVIETQECKNIAYRFIRIHKTRVKNEPNLIHRRIKEIKAIVKFRV
jgi:GH24 family phage-related lysozyme (muramidase)